MARTPSFPNFWQALLLIGFYWLAMSAPLALAERVGIVSHPYLAIATALIVSPLCALGVLWTGYRTTGAPLSEVFPLGGFPPLSAMAVVASTAGVWILLDTARTASGNAAVSGAGTWSLLRFVIPVIYAPVVEELLHRGLILRGFLSRYGEHTAVLLSASLFGLVHAGLGFGNGISAFCFGMLVGYVYAQTASLLPCLLIHSTSNALFTLGHHLHPALGLVLAVGGIGWLVRTRVIRLRKAKAHCEKGVMYLNRAEQEAGPTAGELFQQACREYATAADLAPDSASIRINWGVALTRYAYQMCGDAQEELFAQAYEKYSRAVEIGEPAQGLSNWGGALLLQAQSKAPDEQDRLWSQAFNKFAQALAISPRSHNTLKLWGMGLRDQAEARTGDEAERLVDLAREKFEAAAAIEPDCESTFLAWGDLLMNHAGRKTGEEARQLWSEAQRIFERAIEIEPGNALSRRNCATALLGLAQFDNGDHAEWLAKRAQEHCAAAVGIEPGSEKCERR